MKLSTLTAVLAIILLGGCNKDPKKQASKYTDFERGWSLYYYKKWDSALLMLNRYVEHPDDSLKKGIAYRYMGEIYWKGGDLYGGEENGAKAIYTLDKWDTGRRTHTAYSYNLLGDVSLDLKHYDEAISRYNKAMQLFKGDDFILEVLNGKATAFQKKRDHRNAIAVYDSILQLKPADQSLVARAIDNKAHTQWLLDSSLPVLPAYWLALQIRTDSQYRAGLNASYAHLADYFERQDPDSAVWYANRMYEQAQELEKPEDRLEAMDKLIRLSTRVDQKQYWYETHQSLNDSFQLAKDTTRQRYAMTRYDFQKSKAENLVLAGQNRNQRLWIYGVATLSLISVVSFWVWYRKRKQRMKLESENAIRNSQLKLSQKVHDVVANSLYKIMNELEHTNTIDKQILLDNIEGLYEKSRDISYEDIITSNAPDYNVAVHRLLDSFADEQTNVFIVGNQPEFWNRLSNFQKEQLQLVLNELMVNMKKHSRAKQVSVTFKQEAGKAFVHYKDDGIGFSGDIDFGNGLKNTVSRIKSLNGELTFGEPGKAGASIAISFPLQPDKHD